MQADFLFRTLRYAAAAMCVIAPAVPASAQQAPAQDPGSSRQTVQLTLEEAVRRAVENNPDLEIVRLETQVGEARVNVAGTAFSPIFSSVLGRSSSVLPPSSFLLGERAVDTNDWFSSTGVRQRLPWGAGTWSASWDASRTTTDSPLTSFDPSVQSGLQLAYSQPLLKDFKTDPVRHQYLIAQRDHASSELRLREAVVQTVAAVKQAYWSLKASIANVTVQQRSLELAQQLVTQNKARVDVGQAPPLDLVQAEAEVATRRENLIRATAAAEDAEDHLRRLIMNPSDVAFWRARLDPTDQPSGRVALPDVEATVAKAIEQRYDVARARNDEGTAEKNVAFFRNQKLPDLRLETSYRGSGIGGTQLVRTGQFPGEITQRLSRGYGDVLNQVFASDYPTWSLGVTVSYPLGESYEEASQARAEIQRKQAAQRVASLQLQTAEAIRQAARQVRSTAEREEAARAGATLAEQRFDSEQRRYEVGLSTSFLVTQAQRDLAQAQVNLLQSILDYQSSLVSFEALQLAPPLAAGERIGLNGAEIVLVPTVAPRGVFRPGAGGGF
jgi:outer membrane protein TolC